MLIISAHRYRANIIIDHEVVHLGGVGYQINKISNSKTLKEETEEKRAIELFIKGISLK